MFTECEKRELIRSIALGMPCEEIPRVYEMHIEDNTAIYSEHRDEINEEIQFQKFKYGGE